MHNFMNNLAVSAAMLALVFAVGCNNEDDSPYADPKEDQTTQTSRTTDTSVSTRDAAQPATTGAQSGDVSSEPAQKQEYIGQAQQTLSGVGARLDSWYSRAKEKGGELNEQSKELLEKARLKKDQAVAELAKLKDKSGQAWEDAKPHLDQAMAELEEATRAAARQFNGEADSSADDAVER